MPPRRRGASGYRDVSPRLSDALSAEIRSGDVRLGLGIFETAHEAARAYDTAAWRLRRACLDMNFPEVPMREMAQELAPPPRLLTGEDHHENWRQERRLSLAKMDEEAMTFSRGLKLSTVPIEAFFT
ncbi:ethylene-responsive transcription factor ERF071-like [Aegilops tauschii subsp. strangulata]|uniref:ethylene-responsive transcription factor ERF071-like n=1 Tax=Aegilops tauschii subsp. strangulata TaxID=200361 RepID=UPI00098BB9B7